MHAVFYRRVTADGDGDGILLAVRLLIRCRCGSIAIFSFLVVFLTVVLLAAGIWRCDICRLLVRRSRSGLICLVASVVVRKFENTLKKYIEL